jgi:hypothetical protein
LNEPAFCALCGDSFTTGFIRPHPDADSPGGALWMPVCGACIKEVSA